MDCIYSARSNGLLCEIQHSPSSNKIEAKLFIGNTIGDACVSITGYLKLSKGSLSDLVVENLTQVNSDEANELVNYPSVLIRTTVDFFVYLLDRTNNFKVTDTTSDSVIEVNYSEHFISNSIEPSEFSSNIDVRSISHIQKSDIESASNLYDSVLKGSCERLLKLNQFTLKAERRERHKQTFYKLGWVVGLSSTIIALGLIIGTSNIVIAIGLLISLFLGQFLHMRFSPGITLPPEREELFTLNADLRQQIVSHEEQAFGSLFRLLNVLELDTEKWQESFGTKESQVSEQDISGNGLYFYLDAMNLVFTHRERLPHLSKAQ